jgi:aminoglycoside phosphotransferase
MRKTIYYQREAADPVLEKGLVLDIVRQYAPGAKGVTLIDESGGEGRTYFVDSDIVLKVQRPQQLRSSTSLEKEAFFMCQLEKQTRVNVPRVLGYGKAGAVEYICMTCMPGIAVERTKLTVREKNALLFELGKELRKIHDIDQTPFIESGLFPCDDEPDLKERLLLRYQNAIQKKKDTVSPEKIEAALGEVEKTLEQIHDPDKFVALHVNPYIPHVFVDDKTHQYSGIIDFGDSYIGHPIFDIWYWRVSSRKKLLGGYTADKPVSAAFQVIFNVANDIAQLVNELKH